MRFSRVVFVVAAVFGLYACVRLYFVPGSATYYGLIATVLAWQVAFLLIAADPRRYRPMMIPAVLEKLIWVITFVVLYARGAITSAALARGIVPHGLLGLLFVAAYMLTASVSPAIGHAREQFV
jgi:hypothetical protein